MASPSSAPLIRTTATKKKKTKKSTTTSSFGKQQEERQPQQHSDEAAGADDAIRSANNNPLAMMPSYGMGLGMGGMGMYGMGMGMGMGGMYGGGMYGGGGGMGSQWLMSLNSALFGIQSVVFSLGQAVQIVGMNAQQIRHVYDGIRGMLESALGHVKDNLGLVGVATIDEVMSAKGGGGGGGAVGGAIRWLSVAGGRHERVDDGAGDAASASRGGEDHRVFVPTHSEIVRRRRLAAFRWTVTLTASYFLYRAVRRLIRALIHVSAAGRISGNDYLPPLQSRNEYYGGVGGGRMSHNPYYGSNGTMGGGYGYGSSRYNDAEYAGIHGQRRYDYDPYSQGYGNMNGGYY